MTTIIIDDDPTILQTVGSLLELEGHKVHAFSDLRSLEGWDEERPEVVVSDYDLGEGTGADVCKLVESRWPGVPVLILTGFNDSQTIVDVLRAGAFDYLTKPVDPDDLLVRLEKAKRHTRLVREVRRLRRQLRDAEGFGELVGESPPMQRVYDLLGRVCRTDVGVLVTGETGTGKELAARALHARSERTGPFVPVNCAAVPDNLLESELFGHVRGAFTGARSDRQGLFVRANGGTIFLDEIGETPPSVQVKLLRVLQEGVVRPVGSDDVVPYDARVVAATNRDLEAEVEAGNFREDLYYRLNIVNVHMPPLRLRGPDILLLAQRFVERFSDRHGVEVERLDPSAARCLMAYDWPGNVRELSNCIERAVALARYDVLREEDLPQRIREYQPRRLMLEGLEQGTFLPMHEVERRYILQVLDEVGSKAEAARILELDRKTLYRKLKRWEEDDDGQ